ncbi:MAG TPA: hypothetical protein VD928_03490 [Candidatus Paceibacterota bacterium]|nr:hypothetical protein [Candidatus Paceibacterota bacterium]
MRHNIEAILDWIGMHFFRFWTMLAVLIFFGWCWVYRPEYLTWWKRHVDEWVITAASYLPYPWGDRIESTLGNFGIWVQITLAIVIFRFIVGAMLMLTRSIWRLRHRTHTFAMPRKIS